MTEHHSSSMRSSASERAAARPAEASSFAKLGLSSALCRAVASAGYDAPTPIQRKAIPLVLDGGDLLGCAQTGTGKTAAFALPILNALSSERGQSGHSLRVLVLAPTRELAAQIAESFVTYSRGTGLRTMVIFGGVNRRTHERALRDEPDILVATPGRLLDLMSTRHVSLGRVEHVVLDEADRMLDMGFIHDMRRILRVLPERRQTLLFSATMPREIEELSRQYLRAPRRVAVDPVSSTCEPIAQSVYFVRAGAKQRLLTELLSDESVERALVFTRTKHGANRVAARLERSGIAAAAIHGNKSQSARERALKGFKDGDIKVVVATDLASRGIDVKGLTHVINFELPNEPETYVHRVGRTGRAGERGVALSLCSEDERAYLRNIERLTRKELTRLETPAAVLESAGPEPQAPPSERRDTRGPRGSGRRPARPGHSRGRDSDGRGSASQSASSRGRGAGSRNAPGRSDQGGSRNAPGRSDQGGSRNAQGRSDQGGSGRSQRSRPTRAENGASGGRSSRQGGSRPANHGPARARGPRR